MELTLTVDADVYERLAQRADRYGFESTEQYSEVVLQTVVEELKVDIEDEEEMTERLEDLGYL